MIRGWFIGIDCTIFQFTRFLAVDTIRLNISPKDYLVAPHVQTWISHLPALEVVAAKAKCLPRRSVSDENVIVDPEGFYNWWNERLNETYQISGEELAVIVNGLTEYLWDERRKHFIESISQRTDVEFAGKNIWQNLTRKNGVASRFVRKNFNWSVK